MCFNDRINVFKIAKKRRPIPDKYIFDIDAKDQDHIEVINACDTSSHGDARM